MLGFTPVMNSIAFSFELLSSAGEFSMNFINCLFLSIRLPFEFFLNVLFDFACALCYAAEQADEGKHE